MRRRRVLELATIGVAGSVVTTASAENPVEIANLDELQAMQDDLTADYVLVEDIDASETEDWNNGEGFEPIGNGDFPFVGSFDGNGHVIENLYIGIASNHAGLFGHTDSGVELRNVSLECIRVEGSNYTGGVVGEARETEIEDIYLTGDVEGGLYTGGLAGFLDTWSSIQNSTVNVDVTGRDQVGGLVGWNHYGEIDHSYTDGTVSGNSRTGGITGHERGVVSNSHSESDVSGTEGVGGLVGWNHEGDLINSFAVGNVSGNSRVGGLVGMNRRDIRDSYSLGHVSGDEAIGGFIGYNDSMGNVYRSYSTGSASGEAHVGGLIGWNAGEVSNSFWDTETSNLIQNAAGTGKTTEEMVVAETFADANWDFDEIWDIIEEETYPFLQWQEPDTHPYPPEEFDLTIDTTTGGTTTPEPGTHTYYEGYKIEITAISDTGWEFAGWSGDIEEEDEEIEITIEDETEVIAEFERQEFKVEIVVEGEGTTNPEAGLHNYKIGNEVKIEATPETGWEFVGWSGDVENEDPELQLTVEEELEVIAEFERMEFELSIDTEGEGTTIPPEGAHTYEFGEELELEADPDPDWEFVEWTGDVETDQKTTNVIVEENMTLTARFDEVEDAPDDDDPEDDPDDDSDDEPADDGSEVDEPTDDSAPVEEDDTDDEDEPADDDTPGFGVGGALVAIGGAAYFLQKRLPGQGDQE